MIENSKKVKRYRCVECGKIMTSGDTYIQVKVIESNGQMLFVPTCSNDCAKTVQKSYYDVHSGRAKDVKNQYFQRIGIE